MSTFWVPSVNKLAPSQPAFKALNSSRPLHGPPCNNGSQRTVFREVASVGWGMGCPLVVSSARSSLAARCQNFGLNARALCHLPLLSFETHD